MSTQYNQTKKNILKNCQNEQKKNQPITHSILRNSQVRKKQSQLPLQQKQKYHFDYRQNQTNSLLSHKQQNQAYKFDNKRRSSSIMMMQKKIPQNQKTFEIKKSHNQIKIVCNSVPHTRPKFSFTFIQQPTIIVPSISTIMKNKNQNQHKQTHINTQDNLNKNQDTVPVPNPLKSSINKSNKNRVSQHQSSRPSSSRTGQVIRKDLDYCLYTMCDKLKSLKSNVQKENIQVQCKLKSQNQKLYSSQYRPSLNQIRKNNKLFIDRTVHRIQPQLIAEYIDTVYKQYDIPDPLKLQSQEILQKNSNINKKLKTYHNPEEKNTKIKITSNLSNIEKSLLKQQKYYEKGKLQIQKEHPDQKVFFKTSHNQRELSNPDKRQQTQPQNYFFNSKPKQQTNFYNDRRSNNLISKKQKRLNKNGKKRFLDLTLSKQKFNNVKKFVSPSKQKFNNKKERSSSSQKSKSRSLSRQSNSQKKILNLKNNISNWKDSQHQFVERYSYLQSPYQIIKQQTQQAKKPLDSDRQFYVRIKPFDQLMKISVQNDEQNQISKDNYSTINRNTTISQLMQSKYHNSFFSLTGQIVQEFRYCVLCESAILSANIYKHQQKCIGWIHDQRLYTFKQLYKMQNQEDIKRLIRNKIIEIRNNITKKIEEVKLKEKNDPQFSQNSNKNIISTIQMYVDQSFNQTQTFSANQVFKYKNQKSLNMGFSKIQKNYKNPYWQLMQQSNKLHWFVKLMQCYQQRLENLSRSQNVNAQTKNNFQSTRQKNNISQTFVDENSLGHNQIISQFPGQNKYK